MNSTREIVVDNFAGGGGASTGIEIAIGRSVDVAINHDPAAIAMHRANHPTSKHYTEDVWIVDPVEACEGHPVVLAWFSPDCKHFSKAKGGKPVSKHIRGLSWVILRWAMTVRPRVIIRKSSKEDIMKRECVDCEWCTMIETAHGNIRYICADEDGGNFMGETGLCGWCDTHKDTDEEKEEE